MFAVDNVGAALESAQEYKWKQAVEHLRKLAEQPSRHLTIPLFSKDGHVTKYGGKIPHLGRKTWKVLVGPVPKGYEVLDNLPPGCTLATWGLPDEKGETWIWLVFPVLVHQSTVGRIVRKQGLEVVYKQGCTYAEVKEQLVKNGVNKLVKK